MKVIHITPISEGYEIVELLANNVDRHNSFKVIKKDGQIFYTGGFIITDAPRIRAILDAMPKEDQYEFVKEFKMEPFEKLYLDDEKK